MGDLQSPLLAININIMLNFKIENASSQFLKILGGKYNYKFRGQSYEITPEFLETAPTELQQSFGAFAAKKLPRQPKIVKAKFVDEPVTGGTYMPKKIVSKKLTYTEKVRRELIRLAKSEKIIEEKLNYPKVFQALLTEPHTAFDHKKKTVEENLNLTLIVDVAVGYMTKDHMGNETEQGLPHTLIQVAKTLKGVTVFEAHGLHQIKYKDKSYDYYTDLLRVLPKNLTKNVVVYTQGCGGMGHYQNIKPGAVKFVTPFKAGCNCGCGQIRKAAAAEQVMFYGVNCADKLSIIK